MVGELAVGNEYIADGIRTTLIKITHDDVYIFKDQKNGILKIPLSEGVYNRCNKVEKYNSVSGLEVGRIYLIEGKVKGRLYKEEDGCCLFEGIGEHEGKVIAVREIEAPFICEKYQESFKEEK